MLRLHQRRLQHTAAKFAQTVATSSSHLDQPTKLKFAHRSVPDTFGQLVSDAERSLLTPGCENDKARVIELHDLLDHTNRHRDERHSRATYDHHTISDLSPGQQVRLDPRTAAGKSIGGKMLTMRPELADTINTGLLAHYDPQKIRATAAKYYVSLQQGRPHTPTVMPIDIDAHVAGVFLQNYASVYNVLSEARARMGRRTWRPRCVLDVGYGPATGIVAFNELFEREMKTEGYRPDASTAVIIGHPYMLKRARTILAAQTGEDFYEPENRINTKIQGYLPAVEDMKSADHKYDLIIATHQLYRGAHNFPASVDDHTSYLLKLLAPDGVLILVERGDPNGFEAVARARQIMIRPEDYVHSATREPRLWKGGRHINDVSAAPKKQTKPVATEDLDEMDLPPELLAEFSIEEETTLASDATVAQEDAAASAVAAGIHLEVLGPCTHHGKCPLQLGPTARARDTAGTFGWCKFAQLVQRPRFSTELKKGVFLATKWSAEDSGRGENGRGLAGKGRPFGRSYETSSFSYLMVKRSEAPTMPETSQASATQNLTKNPEESGHNKAHHISNENPSKDDSIALEADINNTARILRPPMKRDGHVLIEVCASSSANIEQWIVPKSYSKQAYYDARKASGGDMWRLGAKTRMPRETNSDKLTRLEEKQAAARKKEQKRAKKKASVVAKEGATTVNNNSEVETDAAAENTDTKAADIDEMVSDAWASRTPRSAARTTDADEINDDEFLDFDPALSHLHTNTRYGAGGARAGRRKVRTTLRGHDPDPLDPDADNFPLEHYFEEIAEVERNSAQYRSYEKKMRRGGSNASDKKNKSRRKAFF
jgi:ribosomal protein RSM22 (predicted rRNA methylase)